MTKQTAVFGGGCFWCTEAAFQVIRGVSRVVPGYAGGPVGKPAPSYEQVCTGRTGHAEVVQVTYDPEVVSYKELLAVFFATHDPTTLNRQGNDVGTQYRSVVFHHSEEQRRTALDTIAALDGEGVWDAPIVTQVAPLDTFWEAEEHHQEYFRRNPYQPYCQVVVAPKVAKSRQRFAHRLRG